ncbi:MAG TPA: alpha-E domain-containing protein [Candidatus Limnocylindria bacterium]|nr:alpha-E domain-containing protein [Candidatus Limnocylindria bacterium]
MLSRVAESIYWMSRYVERAENVARFIDVNLNMMLDASGMDQQWWPLVNTTGDHVDFEKRYGAATQESVIHFLTFDRENPNSMISCLRAARENARSVREIISSEMWLQLNKFYLTVNDAAATGGGMESLHDFYTDAKLSSHLFTGITDATMTHGEAWHFSRLARKLERADKTSRILDVKYFILLRSVADVGTPTDDTQWAAVLRSASAFEMYRKRQGRISPKGIVQFLLLDQKFPRAIHFCLNAARDSLHAISGTPMGSFRNNGEKLLGQLCSELAYASVDEIVNTGLHEYLDALQDRMNLVGDGIFETFFAQRIPEPGKQMARQRTQ